ncbi:Conserved oligomeric Golgi complex subunit 1 [Hypsizygus marmoreus]|uniref:Conserved oligomeric Golgi complex subunit 1 n=1 Tax=Hypsizygus marmoreus TaxID=39966 RepID=A0A369K370_HYPMA|nr:Conserved oligomeric Golgi complex subunit 1 [Hypsizygus marmoreus]
MSRRSSGLAASISAPAIGNGHINLPQAPEKQATRGNRSISMSVSKVPHLDDTQGAELDPDELFAKHTILEVKFVQQRLRADADAKQEELRLMVGERYRDLLQASTSIISIAQSSQRVKQALEETKEAILSQEEPPLPRRPAITGGSDSHLHTLQLLSAHVKLLLDAPEHLWRLIERKKYLPAAWLFLLARVVHRALVREDEQDEGAWSRQGVVVLEEFPLIQRQWDAVSQFRAQIIHKATISLREYSATVEDACATLLTLHLLDSRPLAETLSVFLTQRSKTLHTLLLWKYESNSANGHPPEQLKKKSAPELRKRPVHQVRDATHAALDAISQTVKTAESIFHENDSHPALIRHVLEYIQSDDHPPEPAQVLPPELYITTQTLLTTLPSSTHFLLLPPNLRSYKPYVDLNSSSSSIHSEQFTQKMNEWFRHSSSLLQSAVEKWFADLQSVKEVWSVRASTRGWLSASGLGTEEIAQTAVMLDELCQRRVIEIWNLKLTRTLESFGSSLDSTLSSLDDGSSLKQKQASPVDLLFHAPPLPTSTQASLGLVDTSFQKYKASLRRQIVGRTSLLDEVLATLESCARTIQQDLAYVTGVGDGAPEMVEQLEKKYQPDADALCANVLDKLELVAKAPIEDSSAIYSASSTECLVFFGQVSDELSSSSPFISQIGCQPFVIQDFRQKTAALHDRIIDRWRRQTVSRVVQENRRAFRPIYPTFSKLSKPSGPSSDLVQSLLSLSNAIQELGISRNPPRQRALVQATLYQFIMDLTGDGWEDNGVQSLYDLAFLRKLAIVQAVDWSDLPNVLELRIRAKLPPDIQEDDLKASATESLARTQTLFATLLPGHPPDAVDKVSALMPFGIPQVDQQFQPAIELAKPTSRFGLLLVGGT